MEHGLPQSQVNTVCQSDDGHLWVGTVSGLSAYDGISFTNYSKKDSLAEDWITASFKDSKGNLWFGHWGGSITRRDAINRSFESTHIERFSSYQEVSDFVEDTVGQNIIFSTKGSGVFILNTQDNQVKRYEVSSSVSGSRFINTLFLDDDRNLWVGTENDGIFLVSLEQLLAADTNNPAASIQINTETGLTSNRINDMAIYQNKFWIATNGGVNVLSSSQQESLRKGGTSVTPKVYNEEGELSTNYITKLIADNHGNLWIGTANRGVVKAVPQNGEMGFRHYSVEQGLSFYNIKALFMDRENSIWIGTDVGLNQYISDFFTLYDESVGITNNIIWSVIPDNEGNIWLGTNRGVSQLINADNINNDSLSVGKYRIAGLSDAPVMSIYQDSEGTIWFGSANGNLFKRTKTGTYERINIEAHLQDVIYSICEDDSNNIWLGTRSGAARINKSSHKLTLFTEEDGLGGNSIYKIVKDNDGRMWFAVLGGSLTSYDQNGFRVYTKEDGLNHQLVLSLALDKTGNIWLGCYTGGLYMYDGKSFTNYNKEDGMNSETPYCIVADNENNIWFGTTYGIEKFDRDEQKFHHFGKTEGFLGVEVNPNSTCMDDNGNLWFGTILGAVKYNPNVHYKNEVKPKIETEPTVIINQTPSDYPFNNTFSSAQNNLTFLFTGISLNSPSKVYYKYKMKNDTVWTETTERKAVYTSLKARNYTFMLQAFNADNVGSEMFTYDFEIKVPFYNSYWFYSFQILMISIMLFLAVFYGRKTGGSRTATILASIAIIIIFEYGINYVEDNVEAQIGSIAFIKVALNALLGFVLFPIEAFIKTRLIGIKEAK
ncbi:hypothetical protein KFE98_15200 [bacterium SCSIO 12741]|nr:hypothetical protein KFE98_15200 [bacterium SCSIO 12741]